MLYIIYLLSILILRSIYIKNYLISLVLTVISICNFTLMVKKILTNLIKNVYLYNNIII